ncbi:hypothetical protein HCN44_006246 [Aphidius gifuensis]|uniref:Uncharacterized protein n=1 Tax=Aphidius gifuensis TaxID=684658 RepID=A0A834XW49_APHGI|nr:hypothetical protein HCN44_006246 [Aphidius gifuensis]
MAFILSIDNKSVITGLSVVRNTVNKTQVSGVSTWPSHENKNTLCNDTKSKNSEDDVQNEYNSLLSDEADINLLEHFSTENLVTADDSDAENIVNGLPIQNIDSCSSSDTDFHENDSIDDNSNYEESNNEWSDRDLKFDTKSMQGDRLMFPAANLHVSDVLLMIETFIVKKNFSERDEEDFIKFVKTLAGPEFESWTASHYLRSKSFDPPSSTIKMHFYCSICYCILVARPVMQNRLQYSGYYGCSWCYSKGTHCNGAVHYLITDQDPPLRSHREYIKEALKAEKINKQKPGLRKKVTVLGVKGSSAFIEETPLFDIIFGFPTEKQHGVDLGVAKQYLIEKITNTRNKDYSLKPNDRKEIDKRLSGITPSHDIPRLPLPLSQLADWKSSQWAAWSLYYCIPCLNGILKAEHFKSLALFVESIWTLSKTKISETDLKIADYKLLKFVGEWQLLHGESSMTFNVHSLLHYTDSILYNKDMDAASADKENNIHEPKSDEKIENRSEKQAESDKEMASEEKGYEDDNISVIESLECISPESSYQPIPQTSGNNKHDSRKRRSSKHSDDEHGVSHKRMNVRDRNSSHRNSSPPCIKLVEKEKCANRSPVHEKSSSRPWNSHRRNSDADYNKIGKSNKGHGSSDQNRSSSKNKY